MKNVLTILILLGTTSLLSAQSAFDLSLADVQTGELISMKDHASSKGTAIIFFSAKCPYAKYYETRLASIIDTYADQGVSFIIVNPNAMEKKDVMVEQAEKLNAPYLLDSDKSLANLLGAKKSPEVFLLNKSGDAIYTGAIDDNPQVSTDVKTHYLKDAIEAMLNGADSNAKNNRPVGCMIR